MHVSVQRMESLERRFRCESIRQRHKYLPDYEFNFINCPRERKCL
jgi:hypothetical protein